jgi:hypothetical protein
MGHLPESNDGGDKEAAPPPAAIAAGIDTLFTCAAFIAAHSAVILGFAPALIPAGRQGSARLIGTELPREIPGRRFTLVLT